MSARAAKAAAAEREVAGLGGLSRDALVAIWIRAYGVPPAPSTSRTLMRKAFAWEIQAKAMGGFSPKARRALKAAGGEGKGSPAAAPPRVVGRGAHLVREWNGVVHQVEVVESGYRWRGETWSSLSAIARAITGAKWSGPRFFGLTKRS